ADDGPEYRNQLEATVPGGELCQPEEMGETAVWLCSDLARRVNGQGIVVDGGGGMRRAGAPVCRGGRGRARRPVEVEGPLRVEGLATRRWRACSRSASCRPSSASVPTPGRPAGPKRSPGWPRATASTSSSCWSTHCA